SLHRFPTNQILLQAQSTAALHILRKQKNLKQPKKNMRSIKGKAARKEEESDSDESFHCRGEPDDLVEGAPVKIEAPEPSNAKEIHVPDDQEYYLYAAGLERMTSPQNRSKQQSPSTPSTRRFRRSSTVCSSDSDITRVGSPLLIIKTGDHISSSSVSETSHVRGPVVEPVKPRRKPRPHWRIDIPLPSQFLGRAYNGSYVSPSQHSKFSIPESPDESPMTESPLRESPPAPTRTSRGRRQGVIFNVNNLPDELKRMALDQDSD
ncbi:hypothetical protein PSTT_06100, partial [Puccinia striiformis]